MIDVRKIDEEDALKIISNDESHFMDHKSKYIEPGKVQLAASSFANADGGEIFIGIEDTQQSKDISNWLGFERQEFANNHITVIPQTTPTLPVSFEFLQITNKENLGYVLRVTVRKSAEVHKTARGEIWVRKGAQRNQLTGEAINNLKLSKGLIAFEDKAIENFNVEELISSPKLQEFLQGYSPKTDPNEFLHKQRLIGKETDNVERATYAGVMLFAENPVTILPKKCAIKITRYDTSELNPKREHLKEQFTIEGSAYDQIEDALKKITEILAESTVLGDKGIEKARYPNETIKEIVVNAVIHRDYNISDDILIFIYNNRIEIKNPGLLPGHITTDNILLERFSRNPTIVRLLNKYPDPPNKDIGEGLNTAFEKMTEVKLKTPFIEIKDNAVIVTIPHQPLASPEEAVLEYLKNNPEITNGIARKLTGIQSENSMKRVFKKLQEIYLIEQVPGKQGSSFAWQLSKKND